MRMFFTHLLFLTFISSLFVLLPESLDAKEYAANHLTIKSTLTTSITSEEIPLRIIIPSASINLDVEVSPINGNTWDVSPTKVSFGTGTSYLNESHGNSVLFAHARKGLFRDLRNVKLKDKISIIGSENLYTYKVMSIEKILPSEIDKIKSVGDTNLTLFTCEGYEDQYRLMIKAKREEIKPFVKEVT
jgi:LPXTG-site transpeptidase (sortase) family protein